MSVIVVLILSALAIAMPPLGPSSLFHRLQSEGVTKKGMIGMLLPSAVTKNANFKVEECCYLAVTKNANIKVGVTHARVRVS
jgi:hypothetical protein